MMAVCAEGLTKTYVLSYYLRRLLLGAANELTFLDYILSENIRFAQFVSYNQIS